MTDYLPQDVLTLDAVLDVDLRYALIGPKIGSGVSRDVYECRFDPSLVVKVERNGSFDNVVEWKVWQELSHDDDLKKWLAPCVGISPAGRVLVMKRTAKVTAAELELAMPKVPRFFHDTHENNWGRFEGRYVCHDYAFNVVDDEYSTPRFWGLKRVKWLDP